MGISRISVALFSLFLIFSLSGGAAQAAKSDCDSLLTEAIPLSWVEHMSAEGKAQDAQSQRLRDVVQRSGLATAALNQRVLRAHNEKYTVEIDQGVPTDQAQSGRCWIFAGLNMLRSVLIAEGRVPEDFQFSENYLHFFNMLEKSNRFLEKVVTRLAKQQGDRISLNELRSALSPEIGDGGWYQYFMFLVSKYGLVPKEAMPETVSSENTKTLLTELKRQLAVIGNAMYAEADGGGLPAAKSARLKRLREIKARGMNGIWRILATHLGDPPVKFEYRVDGEVTRNKGNAMVTETHITPFSPQRFATDFVKFDPSDYVVVGNSPTRKTGAAYELQKSAIGAAARDEPTHDVRLLNVTMDRMEELTLKAIEGGQPVWFVADVLKDVDHRSGIMHPNVYERDAVYDIPEPERMPKLSRKLQIYFGLSNPNHAMLLTGFDRPNPDAPVVKFKNENSWGAERGTEGTYHLYREWFRQNVYEVIIHRKFLTKEERSAWKGEAKLLSEHDDLF